MKRYITLVFALLCAYTTHAQTGTIKGTIKDAKTQESIIGASAVIEGTSIGAAADVDGNFTIPKVPAGTHTLVITFVSYQKKVIPNLVVESGKVVVINTALDEETTQLTEVTVTAQRATNTEVAVISEIRAAQQVAVGVSAQQITRAQDRDAAQVARRVPGVSIVDNRFILVRGLSQRYNSVMLNDVITPSTEVDVRSFSFDMIPSNIIDRLLIFKSGAAELPGEFAGGVIKVYTKRAPEENFMDLSIYGGFRSNTTFREVQKYEGGKLDFLGFDDGKRAIPVSYPSRLNSDFSPQQRASYANQLPNAWPVNSTTAPPDLRLSFNMGKRFNWGDMQVGNLTSINYASYNQFADITLTGYENGTQTDLKASEYQDEQFINNVRLGVLHNWWFRISPKTSIEFKNLFNQLGFAETVVRNGQDITQTSNDVHSYSQRFESRSIYSGQLIGKHNLNEEKTILTWQAGFGYTRRTEPDWRRVRYIRPIGATQGDGKPEDFSVALPFSPNPADAGRFFSKLNERVETIAANLEHNLNKTVEDKDPVKLKFGLYTERKDRDFNARFFGYEGMGDVSALSKLPINDIFSAANVTGESGRFSFQEGTQPNDRYDASNTLLAGYASVYVPLTTKLNATIGFRGEYNDQQVESRLRGGLPAPASNRVFSPLPSLNITYNISDKALVRAAYSMSINRPEFRELAPFDYYDFNFNANVIGNYKLKTANIHNADLRWEYYPAANELISAGIFYKKFIDPIESFLLYTATGANSLSNTFVNSKSGESYGVEIEVRKSFSELSNSRLIKNLSLVGNASYIISKVDLGEFVDVPDPSGSITRLDVSSIQDRNRPMQNQSPYLINGGLYYNDEKAGLQASLLYNVFGPRIFAVGSLVNPTVYEMPRGVLDVIISKRLSKRLEAKISIQDIFNQAVRLAQDTDKDGKITGNDNTVRSFRRGVYSTFGFTFSF